MTGRCFLITGGARSGKSAFAESLLHAEQDVVYLATAQVTDNEMQERIMHHQQSRPATWRTVEQTYNLDRVSESAHPPPAMLLDCVSIMTSNIMFDITANHQRIPPVLQQQVEDTVLGELERLVSAIRTQQGTLVMVTNEVGDAIVPENHIARVYRDILGRVNQRAAALCDTVYLVTCGIPLQLK